MKITKINESFFALESDDTALKTRIADRLKVKIKNAQYNYEVQAGIKSEYRYFFVTFKKAMIIPIGFAPFLASFGVPNFSKSDISIEEIDEYIDELGLPFDLYMHQRLAIYDCLMNYKQFVQACTGSGKSAIVSLVADFLVRKKGMKGLVLVPGIGLVTQIHGDILDYNLQELYDSTHLIGGNNTEKHFDKPLTISTWQSVRLFKEDLSKIDFLIVDEGHTTKSKETFDIVEKCINAKWKIGLSGTLPEDNEDRMSIFACVGPPKVYIKTQGLIDLGLATPVNLNIIKMKYARKWSIAFNAIPRNQYAKQMKFIKEYENRTAFVARMSMIATEQTGNTLTLFQHTQHGIDIMKAIYKDKFGIELENKHITGKKAYEYQKKYSVYIIYGKVEATNRELIRKILDEPVSVTLSFGDKKITVDENSMVQLSSGKSKRASSVTTQDDVCDDWINQF